MRVQGNRVQPYLPSVSISYVIHEWSCLVGSVESVLDGQSVACVLLCVAAISAP